ncbi:methyl-accepting chemotaxis protein Aer-like [Tenebrio molitor]|uniref:methyl-accepting chemotaxis protein Aer-like n=1 Tax=Tenebrio molitor TaxID=7067 RepID=UPI003624711B
MAAYLLGETLCLSPTVNIDAVTQSPDNYRIIPGTKPYFLEASMSRNILIPACVAAVVATSALAGYTTYSFTKSVAADRHYNSTASTLHTAAANSLALATRAAIDSSYTGELELSIADVQQALNDLRRGSPEQGIKPLPSESASSLYSFEAAWNVIEDSLNKIIQNRSSNSEFTRRADEARELAMQLTDQASEAVSKINQHSQVHEQVKNALQKAVDQLSEGTSLLINNSQPNSDGLRLAMQSAKGFERIVSQVGNHVPRDGGIPQLLANSLRTGQAFQRTAVRAIDASSGQADNAPFTQVVWEQRPDMDMALHSLKNTLQQMSLTRVINSGVVLGSLALALFMIICTLIAVIRDAKSRTANAEQFGASIQSSQKERSNELQTKDASRQVNDQIESGTKAVQEVHEGVIKISQSNLNIMHNAKAMSENIQSLEKLIDVVRKVANQSATVGYNAYLAADTVGDEEVSKRIRISADAMQNLTGHAESAAAQIANALNSIRDAELTVRSTNALSSLNTIREHSGKLAQSIIGVTEQTAELKTRSEQVGETMTSIHHYASEHSSASEETASAISNLNQQAQSVGETLSHFKV